MVKTPWLAIGLEGGYGWEEDPARLACGQQASWSSLPPQGAQSGVGFRCHADPTAK